MQYIQAQAQVAYETALAGWEAADPANRGDEPLPPTPYTAHIVNGAPEELHSKYGHIVAPDGMLIFESTTDSEDRFAVHPDDASNSALWLLV